MQAFSSVVGFHYSGFSCCGAQALGAWASVVVAHGLSCSEARGIFLDQGSNPCSLHWQADPYPLYHQGGRKDVFFIFKGVFKSKLSTY